MPSAQQHLRFALEAGKSLPIGRQRFGQDLQRHVAVEAGIVSSQLMRCSTMILPNRADDTRGSSLEVTRANRKRV